MSPTLTFRLLTGCRQSSQRGIGFLEGHNELDAGTRFDNFEEKNAKAFRSWMDQWLDGANGPDSHFHNFKSDLRHRNCFVFKYKQHRLYGFLRHPNDSDLRFQLCSLCIYARKNEHESDRAELDRVESWCLDLGAQRAISRVYTPATTKKGGPPWN
jgi:hypothetical protein